MKKLLVMTCLALVSVSTMAQTFKKGERMVNAGIGVGTIEHAGATFTQKVSIEWGVASVGKSGTVGIGATIANAYGGVQETRVMGSYDYQVPTTMYVYKKNEHNRWNLSSTNDVMNRRGVGEADAKLSREDLKAMFTTSYHHALTSKLEAYATVGIGVTLINGLIGGFDNYKGFESKTKNNDINTSNKTTTQYCLTYSYRDIDHADFSGYTYTKVGVACAAYLGIRYSVTDKIGAFGELGMISSALNKNLLKGYDVFTVGASFKF